MRKRRLETWLGLMVLGVALFIAAIGGLFVYVSVTAKPLHRSPQDIQATTRSAPSRDWVEAVGRARQVVRSHIIELNLTGLSVAVGLSNEVVWAEGFGWANLEDQSPITPDTRFRIGTASIALTSAAVGRLIEQDRIRLDEPVQTYVPEFPQKQWPVTLRQLMGHVAGVRTDAGDEGPYHEHCEHTIEGLQLFSDLSLLFEPGTRYRFSSFGWILVSAAVEAAAGEPFLTFMRRQVFDPLGMDDTKPDSVAELVPNRATFYFPRFAADPRYGLHPTRRIDFSCYAGSSVFLSTPSDLVRFGLAVNAGQLLQPATVRLLQAPQRLSSGEETGYGLGWDLEAVSLAGTSARWAGHDGMTMGGNVVTLMTFPERGLVVSVMSNLAFAETESLALKIAEAFAARR